MIAQSIEFGPDGLCFWQLCVAIAFVLDELAAHLCGCQARVKPMVTKLGIRLTLTINQGANIFKQLGQMHLRGLASTL